MITGLEYSRFSSHRQKDGHSIEQQKELLQSYLERNTIHIDNWLEFSDKKVSGFHGDNLAADKGLGRILHLVREGIVGKGDHIFFKSVDRMSRLEVDQALSIFMEFLRGGLTIHFTGNGQKFTYQKVKNNQTELLMPILEMIGANTYVKNLKSSSQKGTLIKVRKFLAGEVDTLGNIGGYYTKHITLDADGNPEITAQNRKIYTKIIELYMDGYSWGRIKTWMMDNMPEGVDAFAQQTTMDQWLKSAQLYGHKVFSIPEETSTGTVMHDFDIKCLPALISKEEWLLIKSRKVTRNIKTCAISLFSNLHVISCVHCGRSISMMADKRGKREDGTWRKASVNYRCSKGSGSENKTNLKLGKDNTCSATTCIRADHLEPVIIEAMQDKVVRAMVLKSNTNKSPNTAKLKRSIQALEIQIEGDSERLRKTKSEAVMDSMVARIEDAEKQKQDLEKQLELIKPTSKQKITNKELEKLWKSVSEFDYKFDDPKRLELRQLISDTFEQIKVGIKTAKGLHTIYLIGRTGGEAVISVEYSQTKCEWELLEQEA